MEGQVIQERSLGDVRGSLPLQGKKGGKFEKRKRERERERERERRVDTMKNSYFIQLQT